MENNELLIRYSHIIMQQLGKPDSKINIYAFTVDEEVF